MERIGVLTSGGDSPGMNATIRAVVRSTIYHGMSVMGIRRGYEGLIHDEVEELTLASVGGIINRGGTILLTARSPEFMTEEGQAKAVETLKKHKIEGVIVIGGDGSFRGAHALSEKWGVATIGVPASIDNDISGTDFTIGFDTAVNTALEAIDRIRDTAYSHQRLFLIEVMGRNAGFLALDSGLAGGADEVMIPEVKTDIEAVSQRLMEKRKRGKASCLVVVAEGDEAGGAFQIGQEMGQHTGYEMRVSVLGHLQRGGTPTALDRILACRLGAAAVEELAKGHTDKMVGLVSNRVEVSNLDYSWKYRKEIDQSLVELTDILSSW